MITVLVADDSVIVREGVCAVLNAERDIEVSGVAGNAEELVRMADELVPRVVVTDIRMPPDFGTEGIDAAHEIRRRHSGTGVVILSQFDAPEYAIALLQQGADGYGYLLKDRVAQAGQLCSAVREVAVGHSWLDPKIVSALVRPLTSERDLTEAEEHLLRLIAEGRDVKAIAAATTRDLCDVSGAIDELFLKLARSADKGAHSAVARLRTLHDAIVDRRRFEQSLHRLLPGGLAEKLRANGVEPGRTEIVEASILMSDVRGFSTIAETADVAALAAQLGEHRSRLSEAVVACGGTVMGFAGDSVMGVFGALDPQPDHADRAVRAAASMRDAQHALNAEWTAGGLPPFGIGIGISSGRAAAALLGSSDRLEYSIVGDCVNLAQRLQQWAGAGEIVISEATKAGIGLVGRWEEMPAARVKGRRGLVQAYLARCDD